jgi:hypothetical protein
MKKLRLDLDTLEVEEFATVEPGGENDGTVFGHSNLVNCGHTPDQACLVSEATVCIGFTVCDFTGCTYEGPTYMCDTRAECNLTN